VDVQVPITAIFTRQSIPGCLYSSSPPLMSIVITVERFDSDGSPSSVPYG
jgi:hypothetical protein